MSGRGHASSTDLSRRLSDEGLAPSSWSNGPHDVYPPHEHVYDKVLVVADGSITFGLPATGDRVAMVVGDRLELPAGTVHDALVGVDGVTCLEAHAPRGRLTAVARRAAGIW
jgi:quercetin dioxygenase-like cupin family protein